MSGSFEDKLKAADEAFVIKPSAGSWMGLQKKLGKPGKFYWIWLIPFLALVGGAIFWLIQTNDTTKQKNKIHIAGISILKPISPLPNVASEIKEPIKLTVLSSEPNLIPGKKEMEEIRSIKKETESDYNQIESPQENFPSEIGDKSEKLFLRSGTVSFYIKSVFAELNPFLMIYPTQLRVIDPIVEPTVAKNWELGLMVNAGRSGLKDMEKSKSALTANNTSMNIESPKTQTMSVLGLGIRISYFPKPRVFISSGIGLQQMGVIYEVYKINNPVNNTVLWKSNKTNTSEILEYKNQVNYLEIPLLAGISLNKGKIGFQFASGFALRYATSSHFLQRYKAQNDPDLLDYVSPNWGAMRRDQYTWSSRLSIGFHLNKSSTIKLEAGYNRHFSKLLNYSDTKFIDINLGIGYAIRF